MGAWLRNGVNGQARRADSFTAKPRDVLGGEAMDNIKLFIILFLHNNHFIKDPAANLKV